MLVTLHELGNLSTGKGAAVTLGNFDGVHLGHQSIFQQLLSVAKSSGLEPWVFVLFPHPREIFSGQGPAMLTTLEDRVRLIHDLGIKNVVGLRFDKELSKWSAFQILEFFSIKLQMKNLVIGPTTHVGHSREGTPEFIRQLSDRLGFELLVVKPVLVEDVLVSSSQIRDWTSKGEMRLVTSALNRFYVNRGVVESGMGKGKEFGFPTANLGQLQTMIPSKGVYAGYVKCMQGTFKAAINVGTRPTVTDSDVVVIEPYLLHFDGNLRGQSIEIQWVERLRDEIRFASVKELQDQMKLDVRQVESIL